MVGSALKSDELTNYKLVAKENIDLRFLVCKNRFEVDRVIGPRRRDSLIC